jgi:hypothetical protein
MYHTQTQVGYMNLSIPQIFPHIDSFIDAKLNATLRLRLPGAQPAQKGAALFLLGFLGRGVFVGAAHTR